MIPTAPIRPFIENYLETCDSESPLLTLATATGLGERRLYGILYEQDELEFDTADRLICHIDVNIWRRELPDLYYGVDLSSPSRPRRSRKTRRCECPGCSNEFTPEPRGAHQAKFCSPTCKVKAYRARRRIREERPARYGTRYDRCPNGHDRSPENIGTKRNGGQYCKACSREKMKAKMQDPAYREQTRLKEAARRAARGEEINARRRELYAAKRAA